MANQEENPNQVGNDDRPEYYIVEYTKFSPYNKRKVKEIEKFRTLDDVFETLRFSHHCQRKLGLKFSSWGYKDGSINPETNREESWVNQDISIRQMTDEDVITAIHEGFCPRL